MDDVLDPKDADETEEDEEVNAEIDELVPGKKKPKKIDDEDDSIDALADEEDEPIAEDSYDDVDLL